MKHEIVVFDFFDSFVRPKKEEIMQILKGRLVLIACLVLQGQLTPAFDSPAAIDQLNPVTAAAQRVSLRGGLLSIHARQAAWAQVLHEITKQSGIRFHYAIPLEGSVTASFTDLPLKQALQRLFGPEANFIFRYPQKADQASPRGVPAEVWILGEVSGAGADASRSTAEHKSSASGSDATASNLPDQDDPSSVETENSQAEQQNIDTLLETTKAEDPTLRMQALSALAASDKADETIVRSVLDAALADEDAGVRGQAVQALANREGSEAIGLLRQALRDSDPSVRLMAVDSIVPQEQGIALLQEALSDGDETVRYRAASKLKEGGIASGKPE
jgi:HEAT repeats